MASSRELTDAAPQMLLWPVQSKGVSDESASLSAGVPSPWEAAGSSATSPLRRRLTELDIRVLLVLSLVSSRFVSPLNGRALARESRACFGMRAEGGPGTTRGSVMKRFGVKKISAARFLLAMPSRKFARLLHQGGNGVRVLMAPCLAEGPDGDRERGFQCWRGGWLVGTRWRVP